MIIQGLSLFRPLKIPPTWLNNAPRPHKRVNNSELRKKVFNYHRFHTRPALGSMRHVTGESQDQWRTCEIGITTESMMTHCVPSRLTRRRLQGFQWKSLWTVSLKSPKSTDLFKFISRHWNWSRKIEKMLNEITKKERNCVNRLHWYCLIMLTSDSEEMFN